MWSAWIIGAALLATAPVGAQDVVVIFGRWANPDTCNPQVSTKVELTELLSELETYRNTCVTTSGFKAGNALFVDQSAAKPAILMTTATLTADLAFMAVSGPQSSWVEPVTVRVST